MQAADQGVRLEKRLPIVDGILVTREVWDDASCTPGIIHAHTNCSSGQPLPSYLHIATYTVRIHDCTGISLFKYTELQDIVVRIIKNASISGFLSAHSGCTFDSTGVYVKIDGHMYIYTVYHVPS